LNIALDYLPGSVTFNPIVHRLDSELSSRIVWFDALVSNVDRTPRNTNMLMWHGALWLIDHGSALYFHHTPGWEDDDARPYAPFARIRDHVLLAAASALADADRGMTALLTEEVVAAVLALVPDAWLGVEADDAASKRRAYQQYFVKRLATPRHFLEEAARAR
jgi:hypothetical protein